MKFFLPVRKKKLIKRKEKEEENDKKDEAAELDDNQIDHGEDLYKEQEDSTEKDTKLKSLMRKMPWI